MKQLLVVTILSIALFTEVAAQNTASYTKDGVAIPFRDVGNNTIVELVQQDTTFAFNIAVATFAAGKRLAWHSHPGGQILIITEGTGYYQERGKPLRSVAKGEVIKCFPGVEHWHGASATSGVSYLATYSTLKGTTKWLEPVTDQQYQGK